MIKRRCKIQTAFTLVELLVVIAIIALLLSILMPTLSKANKMARQVRSASCVRQLLFAYSAYYVDNNGELMWGYPPPNINGKDVLIKDSVSGHTFGYPISSRYPWHISKYVKDVWGVVYSHIKVPERPCRGDSYSDAFGKVYTLSVSPTFGLNSVFLGGNMHPYYKGFVQNGTIFRLNYGSHVVYKASNVKRPARQIVFTESWLASPGSDMGDSKIGYHMASPPHANGELWCVQGNEIVKAQAGAQRELGLPRGRYSRKTITGFFDGHVDTLSPEELDDMTLWANKATDKNYDFKR